jgi:SH3-like domain-containing protein
MKTGRHLAIAAALALAFFVPSAVQRGGAHAATHESGSVTGLPLPRFVSLKSGEGRARRGPGLTHRVDWVYQRRGMPLRITAEFEHWRRVEDVEGAGGWMHYSLLSGVRTVLVREDMVALRVQADERTAVAAYLEQGVVARVMACGIEWCRLNADGVRGWAKKSMLWGVEPQETLE